MKSTISLNTRRYNNKWSALDAADKLALTFANDQVVVTSNDNPTRNNFLHGGAIEVTRASSWASPKERIRHA